jgi:hypothetical protein
MKGVRAIDGRQRTVGSMKSTRLRAPGRKYTTGLILFGGVTPPCLLWTALLPELLGFNVFEKDSHYAPVRNPDMISVSWRINLIANLNAV